MIVERVVNSFLNSLEVVLTANEYLNDTSSSSKLVVVNFDKHLTLKLRDVSYPKQRNEEFNANPQMVTEKNVLKTLQLNLCNFLESHKKKHSSRWKRALDFALSFQNVHSNRDEYLRVTETFLLIAESLSRCFPIISATHWLLLFLLLRTSLCIVITTQIC